MRSTPVWLMAVATGLAFVGPACAADAPAAGSSAAVKATQTHHLMGDVVSVDQAAKTLIVKRGTGKTAKDMTFTAEPGTAAALAGLKPGDQVKVSYVTGQGHLMAKTIAKNDHMAKK